MDMTYFERDGTMRMIGNATSWNDINVSALALGSGASEPDKVNVASSSIKAYAFNGTTATVDELHGSLEILHDWKEGSVIFPHIHWAPTTSSGGNVKWQFEYLWTSRNDVATSSITETLVMPAGGIAWREMVVHIPTNGIDGTGKGIGSRLQFRIFRDPGDAADTYAADAILLDVGVHYERDTIGSRETIAK